MKINDLLTEHRRHTSGYEVDINLSPFFIKKYKEDTVSERKRLVKDALTVLLSWYNFNGPIEGKVKINDGSSDRYHYHIGYPRYEVGMNHQYSTSDWFVLYQLQFDETRQLYIINVYDYGDHNRRKDWNE